MSATDHLGTYAEGWTKGDADMILSAASESFVFDDPNSGRITKNKFAEYLSTMKATARSLLDGDLPDPFMQLSEVVTDQGSGVLTAWCWWAVPGTQIEGSGLIKVRDDGVCSEVISYYAKLPTGGP